jgi:hypothetical protein
MRRTLLVLALAGCTDSSGGGGGGGNITTHVIQLEFPTTPNIGCIDQALADVDPTVPGTQYECSVSDIVDQSETVLPACNAFEPPSSSTNKPCWVIATDPANCPSGDHLSMHIERSGAPPVGKVVAQCVAEGA